METRKTEHGIKIVASGSFCSLDKAINLELTGIFQAANNEIEKLCAGTGINYRTDYFHGSSCSSFNNFSDQRRLTLTVSENIVLEINLNDKIITYDDIIIYIEKLYKIRSQIIKKIQELIAE